MEPTDKAREQVEAIGAAMGLTAAVSELTVEVKNVKRQAKHERRLSRALIVSFTLDVLFTLAIAALSFSNHNLDSRLRQAQVASCQSSNVVRHDDIKLWTQAINDIDPQSKITTPAEAKAKANFILFIDHTFMSVDCDKVG
jgi:hypothetical protein